MARNLATTFSKERYNPRIDANRMNNPKYQLPTDIQADLNDAFQYYDKLAEGYIALKDFKCILVNFGFRDLTKKEMDK